MTRKNNQQNNQQNNQRNYPKKEINEREERRGYEALTEHDNSSLINLLQQIDSDKNKGK